MTETPVDPTSTPRSDAAYPLREKLAATFVHLLLSALAVGGLLWLVTQVWYPDFLFATDGGWQGLRIVILVDLVLGPLLTFVVFRRGKKGLAFDLSLIAALQIVALLGGGWIVHAERPLALVFHDGRFFSITADDYLDAGVPVPDMSGLPGEPPHRVALVPPPDPQLQSPVRTAYLGRDQRLYTHLPWMEDVSAHLDAVLAAGVTRADLESRGPGIVERWLEQEGVAFEDVAFVPYSSRFRLVYLGIARDSGEILGVLDVTSSPPQ